MEQIKLALIANPDHKNVRTLARYASRQGYVPIMPANYWDSEAHGASSNTVRQMDAVFWVKEWGEDQVIESARNSGVKIISVPEKEVTYCPLCDGSQLVAGLTCPKCGSYPS